MNVESWVYIGNMGAKYAQAIPLHPIMAPVATSQVQRPTVAADKVFNPFYSPPTLDNGDANYKYTDFKVCIPYLMT